VQVRINSYLRAVAPLGRESEHVGPFLATFTPTADLVYLNYAIPDDDARPSEEDVQTLIRWFQARQRKPRLEYVTAEAPEVEVVLLAAGFSVEGRLPLMVWQHDSSSTLPEAIELLVPISDEDLFSMLEVTNEAYGSPAPPSRDDVTHARWALAHGSGAVIARDLTNDKVVGAGRFPPVVDGLTEVASIGVAMSHRRRGIGQALARRLALEAASFGATTPFLTAEHEAEARIYERAGFRHVSQILHISR